MNLVYFTNLLVFNRLEVNGRFNHPYDSLILKLLICDLDLSAMSN
jgi:hypothetical protein